MVENEKVKSIFMGRITRKRYNFEDNKVYDKSSYMGKPYIYEFNETERREKIAECEIIRPPFEEKETVYIPEIEKYTTIDKVARSIDGSIYYNVTYVVKEINSERSIMEKHDAETKLNEELIKYEKYLENKEKEKNAQSEELEKQLKIAQFAAQISLNKEKVSEFSEVLYLEPTDLTLNDCSIICYYGKRKYTYKNITLSNLEEMLKGSCYLGIDKEVTLIYIDAVGIGMWIYDALSSRGYNIEPLFTITKVVI